MPEDVKMKPGVLLSVPFGGATEDGTQLVFRMRLKFTSREQNVDVACDIDTYEKFAATLETSTSIALGNRERWEGGEGSVNVGNTSLLACDFMIGYTSSGRAIFRAYLTNGSSREMLLSVDSLRELRSKIDDALEKIEALPDDAFSHNKLN